MAAWVEPERVRVLLRVASINEADAEALIELAADKIRGELGQEVDHVESDVVHLDGTGTRRVLLPEVPVTEVASVSVEGQVLSEGPDYTWSSTGVLTRCGARWPTRPRAITVVYDHGLATIPRRLGTVCAQLAARMYLRRPGVASERIADRSVTYSKIGEDSEFTSAELRAIAPFGHRGAR